MNDLGSLSHCIVESDSGELKRARWLRGRALLASTCLEAAGVTVLLIWPLLNPAVLPSQPVLTPVPIFHSAPQPEVAQARNTPAPQRDHLSALHQILRQPLQIPSHIDLGAGNEPPVSYESVGPVALDGPGTGIGDGSDGAAIVRPAPNPQPKRPVKMSTGVMEARLVHRVEPEYPMIAKEIHLSGTVELRAIIGTDGTIQNLQVVSGNALLVNAAVSAVKQWRYQPTLLSGQPVEVETLITVQFSMR